MNKRRPKFSHILIALVCVLFQQATISVPTASAASTDDFIDKFAANNIMFYNPNECDADFSITGDCGGEITATTQEERLRQVVENYGVVSMNLQIEYGVPWELVFGQMVMESNLGLATDGVNAGVAELGYYNWLGHMCAPKTSLYAIDQCYTSSNGRKWAMYESIGNMIGGYAVDYLRNGYYSSAFQYTDPNHYDLKSFFYAMIASYCPASDGCDHDSYWSAVSSVVTKVQAIAKEKGWPTSEELAKQYNIPIGGKYPDINTNIHDQIDAEPHSMKVDCSGVGGSGLGNGNYDGDGSDVTVIGDSISVYAKSHNVWAEKLPNADLHIESSKAWDRDQTSGQGGDSGLTILEKLKKEGKLRKVLVFALGSNNGNQLAVTEDKMKKMLNLASDCTRIVILTNYYPTSANEYSINNKLFRETADANEKVILADWKAEASKDPAKYLSENGKNLHPSEEGSKLFVDLIVQAIGYKEVSDGTPKSCGCEEGGLLSLEGGLDEDQRNKLEAYFRDSSNDSKWTPSLRKVNCVSMSTFFVQMFTSVGGEAVAAGGAKKGCVGCSDGVGVVNALSALGVKTGTEPQPFSIFSTSAGYAGATGDAGHTGIVLAVEGDNVYTLESGWNSSNMSWQSVHNKSEFVNNVYPDKVFAYLSDSIDTAALGQVVGGTVGAASGSGIASSSVTWKDGWITGGMDGYKKEPAVGSGYNLGDSAHNGSYSTKAAGGKNGPNKILLHNTEGTNQGGGSGLKVYGSPLFPAHFTIDLKEKKVYQHFPITKPADSIKSHDDLAGVQIEIMGFSTEKDKGSDWYLYNSNEFGDDEWAYLAQLLAAISSETGIKLTSSVDWTKEKRLSVSEFKDYEGVLGHMHAPDNDHIDPGNIWPLVSKALGNVKGSDDCGNKSYTGDFPWYGQCDSRWKSSPYGSCGSVCESGCGPSSFAMMATALTRTEYLPDEVALYAGQKGMHICGSGSDHSLPLVIGDHFGVQVEDMGSPSQDEVSAKLKDGWMIWTCGSGPDPFTSGGHCIGVRGITDDGKWLIADSKGNGEENTLKKEWEPNQIYPYMNNFKAMKAK